MKYILGRNLKNYQCQILVHYIRAIDNRSLKNISKRFLNFKQKSRVIHCISRIEQNFITFKHCQQVMKVNVEINIYSADKQFIRTYINQGLTMWSRLINTRIMIYSCATKIISTISLISNSDENKFKSQLVSNIYNQLHPIAGIYKHSATFQTPLSLTVNYH